MRSCARMVLAELSCEHTVGTLATRPRASRVSLFLTGVYIVRRPEVHHGPEPRIVHQRARGVALGEHGYRQARIEDPRGKSRPREEDHLRQG